MNLESFVAGHHGADSMRDKAKRMFGHELRTTDMHIPESMSSPGHTNMRPFRKGGHAAHRSRHHALSHDQSDMHIPRREKSRPIRTERFSKVEHRAEGGEAMRRGGHRKHTKNGQPKYGIGGFFGDLMRGIPLVNMITGPIADAAHLKKGGKVHHKRHRAEGGDMEHKADGGNMRHGGHHKRHHRAEGGEMHAEGGEAMRRGGHHKSHGRPKYGLGGMIAGAAGAPLLNKIPKVGKYMAQNLGMFGGLLPFAEGGHAEGGEAKRRGGGMRRRHRADGGATYTYQGRPYTPPAGWANPVKSADGLFHTYSDGGEAKRRGGGMRRKHRADGGAMEEPALIANAKKRWSDSHPNGEVYAKGGHHRKHRADGGECKSEGGEMRRGGHRKPKYGFGGDLATAAGAYKSFSPETRNRIGNVGRNLFNAGKAAFGYAEGGETKAEGGNMRRGGHHRKVHRAFGGSMNPIGMGMRMRMPDRSLPTGFLPNYADGGEAKASGGNMRHGGHRRSHRAEGGDTYEQTREAPFTSNARKGGHMKKHRGHEKHYASGGGVYEREMVGEHPSRKPHHFSYESEMKGERPVKRAMGGVGKIRHGQATKAGKPINRRVVKGR